MILLFKICVIMVIGDALIKKVDPIQIRKEITIPVQGGLDPKILLLSEKEINFLVLFSQQKEPIKIKKNNKLNNLSDNHFWINCSSYNQIEITHHMILLLSVDVLIGKKPKSSEKFLSIDLENLEFSSVRTFKQDACSVCGSGKKIETPKQELILEELCGRNMGKRTFSITPTYEVNLNVEDVTTVAKEQGFTVENQGDLGLSMRTNDLSVSFMKKGSAVVVGSSTEDEAITLYKSLLGTKSISA